MKQLEKLAALLKQKTLSPDEHIAGLELVAEIHDALDAKEISEADAGNGDEPEPEDVPQGDNILDARRRANPALESASKETAKEKTNNGNPRIGKPDQR